MGPRLGPIIEEMIYRGASPFRWVYVTASSFNTLAQLADRVTSLAFFSILSHGSHTRIIGLPWLLVLMMEIGLTQLCGAGVQIPPQAYALMHTSYKRFSLLLAMLRS